MIKDTLNIQVIAWDTWTRKGIKDVNPADSVYWDISYKCNAFYARTNGYM